MTVNGVRPIAFSSWDELRSDLGYFDRNRSVFATTGTLLELAKTSVLQLLVKTSVLLARNTLTPFA